VKPLKNWLLIGMAIWFLLTLFPPFVGGNSSGAEKFIGFHFLFGTPKYKSPNQQVSRSYSHVNGEKKLISEKCYYPKREYRHCRIDPVRYTLLIILTLMTLAMMFVWGIKPKRLQE